MTNNEPAARREFAQRHADRIYIGGGWVRPIDGGRLDVVNPATGAQVASVAAAGPADVTRAVDRAYDSFYKGDWPLLHPSERAGLLRRLGQALRGRAADLGSAVTLEMGALWRETFAGAQAAADLCDYYADLAEALAEPDERSWKGGRAYVRYLPVGVVAAIVPWNAPLSLSILKLAPALAAGCTLILKSAPSTPLDAILLAECLEDAGIPPGVVSILPGDNAVGEALISDPRIDKVTFTGSTAVGRHIGAVCGGRIARQALELGGKSAAIVLPDMDVETAVGQLVAGSMRLTGQACSALTRILVPRRKAADLVDAMAGALGALRPGDPFDAATSLGPLALERQRERVEDYIREGVREGAVLACGGDRPADIGNGFYLHPTLFAHVDNGMRIAQEEIFGPVVCVIPYADEEEAIAIANASSYGLYASIFTHDEDAVWRMAPRLRAGNVSRAGLYIDRTLPYGGLRQSGVAREGGIEGFRSFQEAQTIYLPS